ncbi:predicted protein [Naegleria gruberi]|uniref:Predicted protein n=1 Tax=Naegleria gruberi TaxID=5762 RepID=D2VGG7_NAEGR|nr:uncharacterized protein NAEGRDRAFT_49340 [Naegleria gruberi]EFC44062.1 predicted protein [Naegleria gruberi]|eukprot:XP_002676806.1 predicted protein [Naegleria gruberi strain NEG-M]
MGNQSSAVVVEKRIKEIGKNFFNIRASFKIKGLINIGTHMSLIRLSNGKYLVIDTVPLDEELKKEIDELTNNGVDIEAVVATHPFHTLAFPDFYKNYSSASYYGTPRHIRNQKDIPWAGNIMDHLNKWSPDVEMRIPAGAEFVAPVPESTNHFNSVWVFSPVAKTIHVDDTINYFDNPSLLFKVLGKKSGQMDFHPSMTNGGLNKTETAPQLFKEWLENLLHDWDFDNACCAHVGVKIGGAHALVNETLTNAQGVLDKLAKKHEGKEEEHTHH